jgi:hypothetical protein
MPPEELITAIRRRPFVPFRLHVSDGSVHEIRHPELLMVGFASVTIGIAASPGQPYTRTEIVANSHIVRLVPVEQAAAQQGNGQSS